MSFFNKLVVLIVLPFLFLSGCGKKEETAQAPLSQNASTVSPKSDPLSKGSVSGVIRYSGVVSEPSSIKIAGNPECSVFHPGGKVMSEELLVKDGLVQNAFVYVKKGLEGLSFNPLTAAVEVRNRGCIYAPHVTGVQIGQPVNLINEDATLHNVHAYAQANKSFNLGLPFQGMKQKKVFTEAEVMVTLKCDVHPWMKGFLGVLPHPYFQVTGENGQFSLKDLPAGEYELEIWHEKLGVRSQTIKIEPQVDTKIDITF